MSIIDELLNFGGHEWGNSTQNVITEAIEQHARPVDTRVSNWDAGGDSTGGFGWGSGGDDTGFGW